MTISPEQTRAARALLNWSQSTLSQSAGVARATLAEFEAGNRIPIANNLEAIRAALELRGVVFLDADEIGPGVRLRKPADAAE